jgi:hypothetical protein
MRRRVVCLAALPVFPAMAAAFFLAAPTGQSYRIIHSRSRVEVTVQTDGLINHSKGLVIMAAGATGRIVYDPLHLDRTRVEFRLPVRFMEPIAPKMTNAEAFYVVDFIQSTWVFDCPKNPEIAFIGSSIKWGEARGSGFYAFHCPGQLEMHGRRNAITLDGIARVTSEGIEVSGRRYIHQRDYGMIPLKDRTGVYKVKEDVEVTFHIFAEPEVENALKDDEAHPPKLTPRAEQSGELEKKGEPPEVKRPEPEVTKPHSGELTKPELEPK